MPNTSVLTINDGTKVVFDSLPYIDQIHPDYEDYAMALIDEELQKASSDAMHPRVQEMESKQPSGGSSADDNSSNRTDILNKEYQTLIVDGEYKSRNHLKIVDQLSKGTAPGMQDEDGMDVEGDDDDVIRKQRKAVRHARARYEAERLRHLTLEAEKGESTKQWKACVDGWLKGVQVGQEASLKRQRDAVEEVNFQREQLQAQDFAPQFQELEDDYRQSVHRRNQYEHAMMSMT